MSEERPILFSAPMVRAILDCNKTQTRRAMRDQPCMLPDFNRGHLSVRVRGAVHQAFTPKFPPVRCPYGRLGDRLWVRETWRESRDSSAWHYAADGTILPKQRDKDLQAFLAHRAPFTWESYKWRPSIHMPRAASRITLEVTGVRVERLQDISEADALAEGIAPAHGGFGLPAGEHFHAADSRQSYFSLWEAINGPGSVEADPWVWVVDFKRV